MNISFPFPNLSRGCFLSQVCFAFKYADTKNNLSCRVKAVMDLQRNIPAGDYDDIFKKFINILDTCLNFLMFTL